MISNADFDQTKYPKEYCDATTSSDDSANVKPDIIRIDTPEKLSYPWASHASPIGASVISLTRNSSLRLRFSLPHSIHLMSDAGTTQLVDSQSIGSIQANLRYHKLLNGWANRTLDCEARLSTFHQSNPWVSLRRVVQQSGCSLLVQNRLRDESRSANGGCGRHRPHRGLKVK